MADAARAIPDRPRVPRHSRKPCPAGARSHRRKAAYAVGGTVITEAFDPTTGLVQSILAGTGNAISNQTFTFDVLGNLTSRTWLNNAGAVVQENSCYDGLNRLTHALITTGTGCSCAGELTMAYDALGNITRKNDVCTPAACFVYGGGGAGPHALTSIVGTYNGVVDPTFTYDANGFMAAGAGRTVTPTSFDMAASITDGSNTAAFSYDTENARYKMVTTGVTAATTYHLNDPVSGAMEEEVVSGGTTTWNDYIKADGVLVAEGTCVGAAPCAGGDTFVNFVVDHLGSVAVIFNGAGAVLNRLNYDAWGKRRNADGTPIDCTAGGAAPTSVTRGFRGQEMLDGVCLINMNARIYDPSLGRFMSADSLVGDETIPQELNRFTYVLNNPLSVTDPSGHGFPSILEDIAAIFLVYVLQQEELLPQLEGFTGPSAAAIAAKVPSALAVINAGILGGIGGLIATGSLKGAALEALEGGLFNEAGNLLQSGGALGGSSGFLGIGHEATVFIAHGLVGGLVSQIGTGRFASGFLAAGISSFAPAPEADDDWETRLGKTFAAAALGGVGSVVGGGKFENGAITGAFAYLLNDSAHRWGATVATDGAIVGGVVAAGACDAATEGACVVATPGTYAAEAAAGAAGGYAIGSAAGTIVDEVIVTAQRVNANSSSSMQGMELYYLINRTSGAIDKIGVTSYPGRRYSEAYLKAENVFYKTQYYFQWRYAAYLEENIDLITYQATHDGELFRLNKVPR